MSAARAPAFVHTHARLIAVFSGGLTGASLRAAVVAILPWAPAHWPMATLAVNAAGATMLGFYLARRSHAITRAWSFDFWAIGLLGSLTTFSALGIEIVLLLDAGHTATAAAYALASPLLGLAAARLGETAGSNRW